MRVPCIPFTITLEKDTPLSWGTLTDYTFILATGQNERKKKRFHIFGSEEKYCEIVNLHWPFWVVRRGDYFGFVDGLRLRETSLLTDLDYEEYHRVIIRELSSLDLEGWEQHATSFDRITESLRVWYNRQQVHIIPPQAIEGIGIGLRATQFIIEAYNNIIANSVNHEEAKQEVQNISELGSSLDVTCHKLEGLTKIAVENIQRLCNFVQGQVQSETERLSDELARARREYAETDRNNRRKLDQARLRYREQWRQYIDPIDQSIREARSEERRCNSLIKEARELNLTRELSQNRRALEVLQVRIRDMEVDRAKNVAQLQKTLQKEEDLFREGSEIIREALRVQESRIETEMQAVTSPAMKLTNSTTRFIDELSAIKAQMNNYRLSVDGQFIQILNVRVGNLLNQDIFKTYVPIYVILFQETDQLQRVCPVFPFAIDVKRGGQSFVSRLKGRFQFRIMGKNRYSGLCDYLQEEFKKMSGDTNLFDDLSVSAITTGLLKDDMLDLVVDKSTLTLLERGIISSKVRRQILPLARKLMQSRLNTQEKVKK